MEKDSPTEERKKEKHSVLRFENTETFDSETEIIKNVHMSLISKEHYSNKFLLKHKSESFIQKKEREKKGRKVCRKQSFACREFASVTVVPKILSRVLHKDSRGGGAKILNL